jgi:hypothetical protein
MIRELLAAAPRVSMLQHAGVVTVRRDWFAAEHGDEKAAEADAWVERVGGRSRLIHHKPSRGLRAGRRIAPAAPPPTPVWDIPTTALDEDDDTPTEDVGDAS